MLFKLLNFQRPATPPALNTLSIENPIPLLDPDQIISMLNLHAILIDIRELSRFSHELYDDWIVPAIEAFMLTAQLRPASATHHHCELGGLIVHTLEVVKLALFYRARHLLPSGTTSEYARRVEYIWTYGVFIAALFHDAGKQLTMAQLMIDNKILSPLDIKTINELLGNQYTLHWPNESTYVDQQRMSVTFLQFVPVHALAHISEHRDLFSQVVSYLSNHPYDSGDIGVICEKADTVSVKQYFSENYQPNNKLPKQARPSLHQQLLDTIRHILGKESTRINQNGSLAWISGEYVYCVIMPLLEQIREDYLSRYHQHGIPDDDKRVITELIDHRIVIPSTEGPVTYIRVSGCGADAPYSHTFSTLCFNLRHVIHPGRMDTAPLNGQVEIISRDEHKGKTAVTTSQRTPTDPANSAEAGPTEETPVDTQPRDDPERHDAPHEPPPPSATSSSCSEKTPPGASPAPRSSAPASSLAESSITTDKPAESAPESGDESTPVERAAQALNQKNRQERITGFEEVPLDDPDICLYFLSWMNSALDDGSMNLESARPLLHTTSKGVFCVWPKAANDFFSSVGVDRNSAQPAVRNLLSSLHKHGFIISRPKSRRTWDAYIRPRSNIRPLRIYGVVIRPWALFDDNHPPPPPNESLTLAEGGYQPGKSTFTAKDKRS